jgi:hypothetical protein
MMDDIPLFVWVCIGVVWIFVYSRCLVCLENRRNLVVLPDPLFRWLPKIPVDPSVVLFILLYISGILGIYRILLSGEYVSAIQCHILISMCRAICMFLTPLRYAEGAVSLRDPVIEMFTDSKPLMNDLFFSGHASTLTMFALWENGTWYWFQWMSMIVTSFILVLARVHYTVDVFAGVAASCLVYHHVRSCS